MKKAFKKLIVSADVAGIAERIEARHDEQLTKTLRAFGTDEQTEQQIYAILNCIDLYKLIKTVLMEDLTQ